MTNFCVAAPIRSLVVDNTFSLPQTNAFSRRFRPVDRGDCYFDGASRVRRTGEPSSPLIDLEPTRPLIECERPAFSISK